MTRSQRNTLDWFSEFPRNISSALSGRNQGVTVRILKLATNCDSLTLAQLIDSMEAIEASAFFLFVSLS